MAKIPTKVQERIVSGIKRFQPILASAKSRDVGESDTVTIVVDMLSDIFGYDKYSEVTSEFAIRGTYCDLATKIDGRLQMLIEVKAIGLDLKDSHVKQVVDYAANQGAEWVVLTNGITWRVYRIAFTRPIDQELVVSIDFSTLSAKSQKDFDCLYLFCKEGWIKSVLGEYYNQKQALSKYFLGALMLSDPILQVLRKELKKISPDVRVELDEIKAAVVAEVLKRDVTEGEHAESAKRKMSRIAAKQVKTSAKDSSSAVSDKKVEDGTASVNLAALALE